jgi:peptidoglycan/xylan/chitin deacetylase (PgdA/CDA1 family)
LRHASSALCECFLVVNYHYFGETRYRHPGIHPTTPKTFESQVETLGQHFEFVSGRDVLAALDGTKSLPRRACLLTFDDGLRCQYEHAVPVLERFGIEGIFFLPGRPFAEGIPLTLHRWHWLRSETAPIDLYGSVAESLDELGLADRLSAVEAMEVTEKFFWDDLETRKLKYLFNVLLNDEEQGRLVDQLLVRHVEQDRGYFERLYLTSAQVVELDRRHALGAHGYSHAALARMTASAIESDILRNLSVLEKLAGRRPVTISYPHGFAETVSPMVFDVAERCGLRFGFTLERSFNLSLRSPLALARVDTNDAPGGKRPVIFPRADNGVIKVRAPMTVGRTRFIREDEPATALALAEDSVH